MNRYKVLRESKTTADYIDANKFSIEADGVLVFHQFPSGGTSKIGDISNEPQPIRAFNNWEEVIKE